MVRKQLSIFVENEPGVVARVTRALADGGVNLRALSVSDQVDDAVLRIVVDDDRKAIDILEHTAGALVVSREVVEVELPDKPGALAAVSAFLAAKFINISYAYGSGGGTAAHLFLRISNAEAADVDRELAAELKKLK